MERELQESLAELLERLRDWLTRAPPLEIDPADPSAAGPVSEEWLWSSWSLEWLWGVLLAAVAIGAVLLVASLRGRHQPLAMGREGMIGLRGAARTEVGPGGGRVAVRGELWHARTLDGTLLPAGRAVLVVGLEGMTLAVRASGPAGGEPHQADAPQVGPTLATDDQAVQPRAPDEPRR